MTRVTTRTLVLLFIAFLALAAGAFNLRDRLTQKPVYSDGVLWRDVEGLDVVFSGDESGGASSDAPARPRSYVVADKVESGGPADLAGIYRGDVLIGVSENGVEIDEIKRAQDVQIYLDQVKYQPGFPGSVNLHYFVARRNDNGDAVIKQGFADLQNLQKRDLHTRRGLYFALLGLVYLGIGVYFLLKQGRAPYVTRFFVICLLAFIMHFYSATDEMRTQFDNGIDLADAIALALLGPFFVHFAALYPQRKRLVARSQWLSRAVAGCLYVPTAILIVGEVVLRVARFRALIPISPVDFRINLDKAEIALFAVSLALRAALFMLAFRRARSVVARQQLKWVTWGMSVAATAFALFYLPTWLMSTSVEPLLESISIAPFVLIPLTLGYSVVRYRLSDIDIVMRRSLAYIV